MKRIVLFTLLLGGILVGYHYASAEAPPVTEAPAAAPAPVATASLVEPAPEPTPAAAEVERFEVPDGFSVEEVYAPDEAGTVIAITFDSEGRLVISREDSTVVTLYPNGDGTFEERVFIEEITNNQGIFFDGADLLAVGERPDETVEDDTAESEDEEYVAGLYRVVDEDGDSRGDRIEVIEETVGGIQEHGPHQPFFGPDGYLYWAIGNHASARSTPAPLSPLRNYKEGVLEPMTRTDARGHASGIRAPGGVFMRKDLDAPEADWEMVVGGFRNQYDGAFNLMGELFTYDSDMEWDRSLPWFRPTRTVHAVAGGDFGWRTGSRKIHHWNIDTLPQLADQGRGSPTGVAFYQAYAYPEAYRDMFLQADWSRGRIIMSKLTKDGATYAEERGENFVYGEPLNVTDVEVGPDGNVYFALGGRHTEGGLYRVVYDGPDAMEQPAAETPLEEALTLAQPRAAYSRARALEIKEELGEAAWQQGLTAVVRDAEAAPERRVRAMELLEVYGPGLDLNVLVPLGEDASWQVRAASAYYLGLTGGYEARAAQEALAGMLGDADALVQRRAAEALIRTGLHPAVEAPVSAEEDVLPLLGSEDRFVRYAGREVLRRLNRNEWQEAALAVDGYPQAPEALMAYVQTMDAPSVKDLTLLVERELELLRANPSDEELLALLRTMQRTMLEDHGVEFGSSWRSDEPGEYEQIENALLERFPMADTSLNQEAVRTLAYLESSEAVGKIAAELENDQNSREQQIFYAYALSNMGGGWDETAREQMIGWFEKVHDEAWRGGASFTGYIGYMREDFLENLPEEDRALAAERFEEMEQQVASAMPAGAPAESPHGISDEELAEELIYDPQTFDGDPAVGAEAYQKATCVACHTFGPIGQEVGPDLTTVGQRFSRRDLVRAVIFPSETISDLWAVEEITTADGQTVSGTIYNEDSDEVVVQVPLGGQVTVDKSEIASREAASTSAMPEGLHHYLTQGELEDLLAFLQEGPEAIPDSMLSR